MGKTRNISGDFNCAFRVKPLTAAVLFYVGFTSVVSAQTFNIDKWSDLNQWATNNSDNVFSGQGSSGNTFYFACNPEDKDFEFYSSSQGSVQENNTLIISKGNFHVFHDIILAASSGSDVSAEFNKIKITGGDFAGKVEKNVYSLYAARGTGKLSNNSVEVSGGNFAGHVMLFAAEQNSEDLLGTENRLENNNITVTGGTFTDDCKVELQAAYADNGDILNNGITIKNLKEGKFEWLNAAHSKAGNAENNYIDISDSDLSLEMTVVAAESNSPVCSHYF